MNKLDTFPHIIKGSNFERRKFPYKAYLPLNPTQGHKEAKEPSTALYLARFNDLLPNHVQIP